MHDYANFIFSAYGVTAGAFILLLILSLRSKNRIEKRYNQFKSTHRET